MGDDSVTGNILGYDLNEKNCQISFYSEAQQEPQTMELVQITTRFHLCLGGREMCGSLEMMPSVPTC